MLSLSVEEQTSISVQWQPQSPPASGSGSGSDPASKSVFPPAPAVLGFRLRYRLKNDTESQLTTLDLPAQQRQYMLSGVLPGATYVFALAAKGSSGYGKETQQEISAPEYPPTGYPSLASAINATCCTLLISWNPPDPDKCNGALTSYTLAYGEANGSLPPRLVSVPAEENSYTVIGLNPDTAYHVRMRAHTKAGAGPFGPQALYRTVAFDTGRTLDWAVPVVLHGIGIWKPKSHHPS